MVEPEDVPGKWPDVADMLAPAVDYSYGRWDMKSLLHMLCLGHMTLWIIRHGGEEVAALVTQIVEYPRRKMLSIQFIGGKGMNDWAEEALRIIHWCAKNHGCDGVEAVGRQGFWPMFKSNGYQRSFVTYESIEE